MLGQFGMFFGSPNQMVAALQPHTLEDSRKGKILSTWPATLCGRSGSPTLASKMDVKLPYIEYYMKK